LDKCSGDSTGVIVDRPGLMEIFEG